MGIKKRWKCTLKNMAVAISLAGTLIFGTASVSADSLENARYGEYDFDTGKLTEYSVPVLGEEEEEMPGEEGELIPESAKVDKKYVSRWVKRGRYYYYYNKNGKLLKNGTYKIKGAYYCFDKKGRRLSGKFKESSGFVNVFSAKTGKCTKRYIPIKITKVFKEAAYGYAAYTSNTRELYIIPLTRKLLVDSKGNPIKASSVKKGDIVRVYTTSWLIQETCPAFIPDIYNVKLVKRAARG